MDKNKLYIDDSTGETVTPEMHYSIMMLIKVLFKLKIINTEQAMTMASRFRILFV